MFEEDVAEFTMGALVVPADKPVDAKAVYEALANHRHVIFTPPRNIADSDAIC